MSERKTFLVGRVVGDLTVVEEYYHDGLEKWFCLCSCSCGGEARYPLTYLKTGKRTHCGHAWPDRQPHYKYAGSVFGKVTVVEYTNSKWRCECECGTEMYLRTLDLQKGAITSCGCSSRNPYLRHGHCRRGGLLTPEYRTWSGMRQRCRDDSRYTERGITVCDRWLHSFPNFLEDMGPRPSSKHSIDRINNDGNYEPSNCRWATATEQVNNRRVTLLMEFGGKSQSITQWARQLGKSKETLRKRLKQGLEPASVLFKKGEKWTLM